MYEFIAHQEPMHGQPWVAVVCILITFGAVVIEAVADYQRRTKYQHDGSDVYKSGVWSWSRHPNYFGEIMFWVGLFLYAHFVEYAPIWTGIGALAMILLFVFISIPMMEDRQVANKPGYKDYQKRVSFLVPWPPRTAPNSPPKGGA
jgi:steroid 5-alpha reductase family enzyme